MSTKQILLGFLPWIAFSVIATRVGVGAVGLAALLALVVAVWMAAWSISRGRSPKLLELTGIGVFAVMSVVAAAHPAVDGALADYGRGLAALVLAAIIMLTLPIRPFTEQYARASVPQQYWDSPRFHAINRRISAAWGGTVAVMAVGHLVAGALTANAGHAVGRPVDLVLNWIVPGLLVLATVRYTRRVVARTETPASIDAPTVSFARTTR